MPPLDEVDVAKIAMNDTFENLVVRAKAAVVSGTLSCIKRTQDSFVFYTTPNVPERLLEHVTDLDRILAVSKVTTHVYITVGVY